MAVAPADLVPIRPLSEVSSADVPYAGGKGANLGQLTRTGLPVPPGFVIGAAHQGAHESDMPYWLAAAIGSAYDELCEGEPDAPVAVRSSPIAEDTASAWFAGMTRTFLNVRGREAVLDAVKRCRQSVSGARGVYHRGQRRFSQSDMDNAVVVQRQIPSTRGGVMFTIDPASGERDHLVIEGSFGLGESVVSGEVCPDRYVVDKSSMAIVARSVRPKELAVEVASDGGTVKRDLGIDEGRRPVLVDDEVLRVAELGVAIEREYGAAQDIEWAFDPQGNVWMLQSRPITTLGGSGRHPRSRGSREWSP